MAELKTKATAMDVREFLNKVEDIKKREDSYKILEIMQELSGEAAVMWGTSIIGFGKYHYKYASGHEGEAPLIGFSPRKQNLALYIVDNFDKYGDLMERLGKYKTGKVCLYVKRLEDIDIGVLRQIIERSIGYMRRE